MSFFIFEISRLAQLMRLIVGHIFRARGVRSVEDLYSESELSRAPKVMPFGKHKGQLLTDVPGDYRQWLLNEVDIDP